MNEQALNIEPGTFEYLFTETGWMARSQLWKTWNEGERFETREAAIEATREFLMDSLEANKKTFWFRARATHTYRAQGKRCNLDKITDEDWQIASDSGLQLIKVRRYKDPKTGEIRRTVELEIAE